MCPAVRAKVNLFDCDVLLLSFYVYSSQQMGVPDILLDMLIILTLYNNAPNFIKSGIQPSKTNKARI